MAVNSWWNNYWKTRSLLQTVTGSAHSSGVHFVRLDIDLTQLVADGRMQSDFADLRIICQTATHNINVPYYLASNPSPERVFFAIQHDAGENENISSSSQSYYAYYDNDTTYDTEEPDDYVNINFPQAPYSAHPSGYATQYGTYFDRYLLRLNDDPSDGPEEFADVAGNGTGISRHYDKVQKGHSGVLDQSVFFDGDYVSYITSSGTWIEIAADDTDIAVPSGNWAVDFWLRLHPKGAFPNNYGCPFYHPVGYTAQYDEPYPAITYLLTKSTNTTRLYARCNFSYQTDLYQYGPNSLPSGTWNHYRIAYRTGGSYKHSRIHIYENGQWVDTMPYNFSNDTQAYAEDTAFMDKYESAPCYIGYQYRVHTTDDYMLTGWLEQMRYSSFVFPAISGTALPGDEYHCAPDWVEEQYVATPSAGSLQLSSSGNLGGYLYSAVANAQSGTYGGYILSREGTSATIGGILAAITDETSDTIGGYVFGAMIASGSIGGIMFCSYGDINVHSVEGLARTLVKANSDEVIGQNFSADSAITLYGSTTDNFDAQLGVYTGATDDFDAELSVAKIHFNPYVDIIETTTDYDGSLPATCTLTASGTAYNYNNEAISSGIHYVAFVWGDNDYTVVPTPTASGAIWSATHTYSHSGIYKPTVFVRDKYGRIGSDDTILNLASGLDTPYIELTGTPRSGQVPSPLTVDFTATPSGTLGAYTLYWSFGNGISYFNNGLTQQTSYAMPGHYTPFVRIEDSRGLYVVDTLRVGYNT